MNFLVFEAIEDRTVLCDALEVPNQCQVCNMGYPSNNCGEGTVNIRCQLWALSTLTIVQETPSYEIRRTLQITLFIGRMLWLCPFLTTWCLFCFFGGRILSSFEISNCSFILTLMWWIIQLTFFDCFNYYHMSHPLLMLESIFINLSIKYLKCVLVSLYVYFEKHMDL